MQSRRLMNAERDSKALELRKSGLSYEQIAKALSPLYPGISGAKSAFNIIDKALSRLADETEQSAQVLRQLEIQRLDVMLVGLWPEARAGKGWAVDRCLAIMDRRSRLLGLDAPLKVQHTVITEDLLTAELQRLEEEIEKRKNAHLNRPALPPVELPEEEPIEAAVVHTKKNGKLISHDQG